MRSKTDKLWELTAATLRDDAHEELGLDGRGFWVNKEHHTAYITTANKILKVCKRAGLKFVLPVITSDPEIGNERIEEIDIQ